ncbi:hypothetical protein BsWGS_15982 [Bradybaena similaris]
MAQADRDKTRPWIARDLLSSQLKSYTHRFEGDTCLARIIISETGECLLEDGDHHIPAVFSTTSTGSWDWNSQRQLGQLKHSATIRVLVYTYSVFRAKDGNFQFAVAVDRWEHIAGELNAGWGPSIDVNSIDTVRKYLQGYLLAGSGMNNSSSFLHQSNSENISHLARLVNQSESQSLANQIDSQILSTLARLANQSNSQNLANQNLTNQSNSQNLSILARLANQSSSSLDKLTNQAVVSSPISQCHQHYISVGSGTEWIMESDSERIKSANSTSADFSINIPAVTSSTQKPTADMSVVHMNETSDCTKIVSRNSNKSTSAALQDSFCQEGSIKHNCSRGNKLLPEPHQDQATLSEESISPSKLLELMAHDSMHDSNEKCAKEKVNHSGQDENKQPHDCQKSSPFLERGCRLQAPTFWDLFVPPDQMKILAQLPGWTSSDESFASIPSPEFLRLSSSEKRSSSDSGSLFSEPTLKDDITRSGYLPDMIPISNQPIDDNTKASFAENVNQNRKDSILNLKIDSSKFCDRQNSNESELDKDNSSSLFSDAEHNDSSVVENVDIGLKTDGKNVLQQQNYMLAGIGSNIVVQGGITLKSNKGSVSWQCHEKEIQRSEEQDSRQMQVCQGDSTQTNTDSETNVKSFNKQEENRSLENHALSAVSKRHKTTCSERNLAVFTEQQKSDSPCVNPAVMSLVIDLSSSSSDDIYVIAGHDTDSNSENLVSSTEPADSEHLILSTDSENCAPSMDSGNVLLTYPEKLVSSSSDSYSPIKSADSEGPIKSADSEGPVTSTDSHSPITSTDSERPITSANSLSPITSADSTIAVQHITCLPSPGTKSLTHIQPSSPLHTHASQDAISKQQRTQNNKDTDKCPCETAVLISSVPSTKARINISPPETTADAVCTLQGFNNISECQETSRFDSLHWHKEAGARHTVHSVDKCGGSTCSPSCFNSARKRCKSAARQVVSENTKEVVKTKKPNEPLPPQKSQQQKTMALSDRPQKKSRCQFKESSSVGKSFFGISGQCAVEVPGFQPKVVLTDVLKSNTIVPDCIPLFDIHSVARSPFIMETKRQQILLCRKDEPEKRKYYSTRSYKRQNCDTVPQTDFNKKQFTISITEIGKCDANIQEIKTLKQSVGTARSSSATGIRSHSGPASSIRYCTRLRQLEAEQLDVLGVLVKPVESTSYVQNNSGNSSHLKVDGANSKKAVTKSQSLKAVQCQGNESCGVIQVPSLFQNSAAASDWRDVAPVLDSDWELSQEGNNRGSVLLAGALAAAPALGSGSVPAPGALAAAPALDNSCEPEEENSRELPAATPESQGFVFCEHDESGEGAVGTSVGFMPTFTEAVLTDSEDLNNPWVCARLDQSLASVINYVCSGKHIDS